MQRPSGGQVGDERGSRALPGLGCHRLQDQDTTDGQATGRQPHQSLAIVGVQPLDRPTEDDGSQGLLGHHLEMVEDGLGSDVQAALYPRLDRRLARIDPVGIDPRTHQRLDQGPATALDVEHPAAGAANRIDGGGRPPRSAGIDEGNRRFGQLRCPHRVDRRLQVLDVVDDQVQHARDRPGKPDDLVDDEVHIPAGRLADQALDVHADRLVGQYRHGDVHVGRAVDQCQRLAEPRLALHAHRGELEEQLVQFAFESGRQVARGPSPLDLGIDLGHHLGQIPGPACGIEILSWLDGLVARRAREVDLVLHVPGLTVGRDRHHAGPFLSATPSGAVASLPVHTGSSDTDTVTGNPTMAAAPAGRTARHAGPASR